jgi:type 1 glutamine amidotransferase
MMGQLASLCLTSSLNAADQSRVLILAGDGNPRWRETTPEFRRILDATGRFDTHVCECPSGLSQALLKDVRLVIDDGAGVERGSDAGKALAEFVASGNGLVITQGGLLSSRAASEIWPAALKNRDVPPVGFLELNTSKPQHPILMGLASSTRIADAMPTVVSQGDDARVIAAVRRSNSSAGRSESVPAIVVGRHGKGRTACFIIGHDASAVHEPAYIVSFARACEWAATGNVTLPSDFDPDRRNDRAVKTLLVTGGHDHETEFYSLFAGNKDLDWTPVDTSANAFQKDIRNKYDVLILYDFTRDMDETHKKNLRDYVESGKGVVVLHHALLNFQTWKWWSEDVVGGRYRLQREGEHPSSSVKNDQQIFVTPAIDHPVLAGIRPFHIVDEAYKSLFMSERIKPLLTTDNATSDVNLAWIGPCTSSRVVAIQLGHGHSAFGHPSYRKLVHNAVLWAAGRTP